MRRLQFMMVLTILLQACSLGAPVPASTPALTSAPMDTPTPSLTPSITPSPTIVRLPTQDFSQPFPTPFVFELFIGSVTVTPFATPELTSPGSGFSLVTVSNPRLYWGGCKYNSTVITAEVDDPEGVISVVIFTRVKSAENEDSTPWTSGNVMLKHRDGTFTYVMRGSDLEGHNHYKRSWVIFQLVATDKKGEEVGRSKIYTDAITLAPCMCLDPSTGCPPTAIRRNTPTPTSRP
jgi:hypothetical protein